MTPLSLKRIVTETVGDSVNGLVFFSSGNVPEQPPSEGYIDVDWSGGRESQRATGLDMGVIAVAFRSWGPQYRGDGIPTTASQQILELFRNRSFLAPEGDTGVLYYVSNSYRDYGTDSRGYYRVDRVILLSNFTQTEVH